MDWGERDQSGDFQHWVEKEFNQVAEFGGTDTHTGFRETVQGRAGDQRK